MLLDYLFLPSHYDQFSLQSEWVSSTTSTLRNKSIRIMSIAYEECREQMAYKMVNFNRHTSSVWGWVKSIIPGTAAFHARVDVGNNLAKAKNIFFNISLSYFKHQKVESIKKKSVEIMAPSNHHHPRPVIKQKRSIPQPLLDEPVVKSLVRNGMWR